jgi:glycosyltransferase involved in cell wall biosynthesis
MISILIPTYNYKVLPLVEKLRMQCAEANIPYEIVVLDDASSDKNSVGENLKINTLENCNFQVLEKNIGRSKIRNLLSKKAKYSWMLFLDADTTPLYPDYIKRYLSVFTEENFLVFGGIDYPGNTSEKFSLRHKYGLERESLSLSERQKNPYRSFITMGFAVRKEIFETIQFNEQLAGYGYEDSVFAFQLKAEHIPILHIDNPVIHLNLESNEAFLNKSQLALQNLLNFYQKGHISANSVKILEKYLLLKKYGGLFIIRGFFKLFKKNVAPKLKFPKTLIIIFRFVPLGVS